MTKSLNKLGMQVLLSCLGMAAVVFSVACNSAPTPAPDTRAADEALIRKTDADWVKAAQSRKADDWVAFYSDDAVVLPPNDKTASTKESIRKSIAEMFAMPNVVITWERRKSKSPSLEISLTSMSRIK